MQELLSVCGKTILLTGGSSGLGAHFAETLARLGARVIATARREERLRSLVERIERRGGTASFLCMDMADAASIEAAFAAAGPIDILINNAGVTLARPVLDQDEADWDLVMDTNLKGAFLASRAAGRSMRAGGKGGAIVNVASILGLRQAGQVAGYATSKAGLIQLTKLMAVELARYDIRVNALAPGYFDTDLNADFWATEKGQALIKRIPQQRLGKADELLGPLLLLCSDASSYMTGSIIAIDGGHLCSTL